MKKNSENKRNPCIIFKLFEVNHDPLRDLLPTALREAMWAHDQRWRRTVPVRGGGHTTHRHRRRRINKFILTALFGQRTQIRGERRGRLRENELPLWHASKTIAAHALQIPAAAAVSSAAVGMHTSRTAASKCIHLFRAPRRNHSVLLSFLPPHPLFVLFFSSPIHPFCLPLRPSRWNLREWHRFSEVENKYRLAVASVDGTRLQPSPPRSQEMEWRDSCHLHTLLSPLVRSS